MRKTVATNDIDAWAASFLGELAAIPSAHGKRMRPPSS